MEISCNVFIAIYGKQLPTRLSRQARQMSSHPSANMVDAQRMAHPNPLPGNWHSKSQGLRPWQQATGILALALGFCLSSCQSTPAMRLGDATKREWDWADVPVSVVEHAKTQLTPPAENWTVTHLKDHGEHVADRPFEIVLLRDSQGRNYHCTVIDGRWTWLGDTEGLRHLSSLYQTQLQNAASKSKGGAHLPPLCGDLAFLHRGSYRVVLRQNFEDKEEYRQGWIYNTPRTMADLLRHCVDPQVRWPQGHSQGELIFGVIVADGSVEQWRVHLLRGKMGGIEISHIQVRQKEPPGTFNCPHCG